MPAEIVLAVADQDLLQEAELALRAEGLPAAVFADPWNALIALEGAQTVAALVTSLDFSKGQPNGLSLGLMTRWRRPGVRLIFIGSAELAHVVGDMGQYLAEPVAVPDLIAAVRRVVHLGEDSVSPEREELVSRGL